MSVNISFDNQDTTKLEEKRLDLEAGILGKFFGNVKTAPTNIAGITILSLLLVSILVTFIMIIVKILFSKEISDFELISDIWTITTPIISLILGYLFGKNT